MGNGHNGGERPYINGNGFDSLKDFKITPSDPQEPKVEGVLPSAEQQVSEDRVEAGAENWMSLISDQELEKAAGLIHDFDLKNRKALRGYVYSPEEFWNDFEDSISDEFFRNPAFKKARRGLAPLALLDLVREIVDVNKNRLTAEYQSTPPIPGFVVPDLAAAQAPTAEPAAGEHVEPVPGVHVEAARPEVKASVEQQKAFRVFIKILQEKQAKQGIRTIDDKIRNFEEALQEGSVKAGMAEDALLAMLYELSSRQREYEEVVGAIGNMDAPARRRQLVGQLITLLDQQYGAEAGEQEAAESGHEAEILQQGESYIVVPGDRGGRRMVADFPSAEGSARFSVPVPESMNLDTPDQANDFYNFVYEFLLANVPPGGRGEISRLSRDEYRKLVHAWNVRKQPQARPVPAKPAVVRLMPTAPKPPQAAEATRDRFGTANEIYMEIKPRVVKIPQGTIGVFVDKGVERDYQEDRAVINSEKLAFASVDGMGGMGEKGSGAWAAQMAAEWFHRGFEQGLSFEEIQDRIHTALKDYEKDKDKKGAGICYIAARIEGKMLKGAQAGDVRLFVIRNGVIAFTTKDQNNANIGRPNEVTNAVSGEDRGETIAFEFPLEPGDRVVMASDGLTGNLSNEQVAALVQYKNTEEALDVLRTESARLMGQKDGKKDNINVVIFDYNPVQPPAPEPAPAAGPKKLVPGKINKPAPTSAPVVAAVEAVPKAAPAETEQQASERLSRAAEQCIAVLQQVGRELQSGLPFMEGSDRVDRALEEWVAARGDFHKHTQAVRNLIREQSKNIEEAWKVVEETIKKKEREEKRVASEAVPVEPAVTGGEAPADGEPKKNGDKLPRNIRDLIRDNQLSPDELTSFCEKRSLDPIATFKKALDYAGCPDDLIQEASSMDKSEEALAHLFARVMGLRRASFRSHMGRGGEDVTDVDAKTQNNLYNNLASQYRRVWQEYKERVLPVHSPEPPPLHEAVPPEPPKPPEKRKEHVENSGVLPNRAQYEIFPARSRLEINLPANASLTETIVQLLREHPELISVFGGTGDPAEAAQKWFAEYAASYGRRGEKATQFDRSISGLEVSLVGGKARVNRLYSAKIRKPTIS